MLIDYYIDIAIDYCIDIVCEYDIDIVLITSNADETNLSRVMHHNVWY